MMQQDNALKHADNDNRCVFPTTGQVSHMNSVQLIICFSAEGKMPQNKQEVKLAAA